MEPIAQLLAEAQARKRGLGETTDADLSRADAQQTLADAKTATQRYTQLLKRVAFERQLLEQFKVLTAESLAARRFSVRVPKPPPLPAKAAGMAEEAALVISDSHVGKVVEPSQTGGFGHYNPAIFIDRALHLEATVQRLVRQNIANPIRRLHVWFLGDLVEGALNHGQEIPSRWYVVDQVLLATWVFYQFLARLATVVPAVTVRGIGGNHARWMNQKRPPTEGRYSNLDFILLGQIQALVEFCGPRHIEFMLDENPFPVFDVFKWRFKLGHGDHLKGGDRALHIPAHAIGREINATTQRHAARGQRPPDYYLVGDKHRHMSIQTATGRYMVNGAWFDADGFALHENFTPGRPFQMFFGIHPRLGKSWSYDLYLDPGTSLSGVNPPYRLPARLKDMVEEYA